jgi:hypothetical protein
MGSLTEVAPHTHLHHPNDGEDGWTNCHLCFAPIRVAGYEPTICPVISQHGRCELPRGHADAHHQSGSIWWRT